MLQSSLVSATCVQNEVGVMALTSCLYAVSRRLWWVQMIADQAICAVATMSIRYLDGQQVLALDILCRKQRASNDVCD